MNKIINLKNNGLFISVLKSVMLVFVSVLVGLILMTATYSAPTDRALVYANNSRDYFSEDLIKSWTGNLRYAKIDTMPDACLFNMALCRKYDSPIKNAMLNPLYLFEEESDDFIQLSTAKVMNGETSEKVFDYGRYWQGSVAFIFLGLNFFDISGLKTISMVTVFAATVILLHEVRKKNKLLSALTFIVLMFLNPITISMNFAMLFVFLISLFLSILMVRYNDYFVEKDRFVLLMALSGILTSFLDFLTFPLLSYGMPLLFLLCFMKNEKPFFEMVKATFAWIIGYVGMWAGKWIVSYAFVGPGTMNDAISSISLRTATSGTEGDFSYIATIKRILEVFDNSYLLLIAVSIFTIGYFLFTHHRKLKFDKKAFSALVIGCSPFVWYFVVRNHTYIHPWFEYRQLAVTLLAIYVIFSTPFNKTKE